MRISRGTTEKSPARLDRDANGACAKNQSFERRLGFAIAGIGIVAKTERSFRSQALMAVAALVATGFLRPEPVWWALLALAIGFVLALECVNGALESALDRLHPEHHPAIGHAKDAAAGAVLIASLASAAVAGLMLLACLQG